MHSSLKDKAIVVSQHSNPARTRRVRDPRGGKWFFIHNALLRDGWGAKVGPSGVAIYAALALHADARTQVCWPSYQTLADLIGTSRAQAIRAVKALERYNLVEVVRRAGNQTNEYFLLDPDQWGNNQPDSGVDEVVNLVDHLGDGSHSGLPPGVTGVTPRKMGVTLGYQKESTGVTQTRLMNKTHKKNKTKMLLTMLWLPPGAPYWPISNSGRPKRSSMPASARPGPSSRKTVS